MAFGRRKQQPSPALRIQTLQSSNDRTRASLVAASYRLNTADRKEAARQMRLRQGWQLTAWAFRDQIGELRYALNFLANCAARMKVFPAAYPLQGETDNPVALSDLDEQIPAQVITACAQAMSDLGNGRLAISQLMHKLSTNKSVAGECWLLGLTDPATGLEEWSIRSITEIAVKDDKYFLREVPSDSQGVLGAIELDPESTVLSRIWTPHPQWQILADAPTRAMQDDCESLLIYRRMIRAWGRSRTAGNGLLLIPEEIELKSPNGDNADPEADDFLGTLGEMMMMPLDNEGAASAVVPGLIRGKGEFLDKIKKIDLWGEFPKEAAGIRDELVGIIATTIDLPKEVVLGTVDLNHWSAWQVDDNTFRHHVEPHVIHCCDSLTGAYLRPYLEDEGIDPAWVDRIVLWYDPVELVTHPDRTEDAQKAYGDMVISAEAYRREGGWAEEDAPTMTELEARRIWDIRALPLNLLMALAAKADPTLVVPAMTGPPQLPGIKPGGVVDVGEPPTQPGVPGTPTAPVSSPPSVTESPSPTVPGPPPEDRPPPAITAGGGAEAVAKLQNLLRAAMPGYGDLWVNEGQQKVFIAMGDGDGNDHVQAVINAAQEVYPGYEVDQEAEARPPADEGWKWIYHQGEQPSAELVEAATHAARRVITAASRRTEERLSRKLMEIDRDLRVRLQTAANAAMLRQLERAGARLRTKVAKDETMRTRIAHKANERAAAYIGRDMLTAAGISASDLLTGDWSGLRAQFFKWTEAAQNRALVVAGAMGAANADQTSRMAAGREAAWTMLAGALGGLSEHLLYDPDPNTPAGDWGDSNPDTLVPTGVIRAAIGLAGGASPSAVTVADDGTISTSGFTGGIGTGDIVTSVLSDSGGQTDSWRWDHASTAQDPFEPHLDLDGIEFESFDDEALANPGDWPAVAYLHPGDHGGCSCDAMPLWSFPGSPSDEE